MSTPLRGIEGHLSRVAQSTDPALLVTYAVSDAGERSDYRLTREGADLLHLGDDFSEANRALQAWRRAQRAE